MRLHERARRPSRQTPRLRRLSLAVLVLTAALGWVGTTPQPAEAQVPTPARPVLLIGGTFVGIDFGGYDPNQDGVIDVPGWPDVKQWLTNDLGYDDTFGEPGDTNPRDALFIGEMKRQDETPPGWDPQAWRDTVTFIEEIGGSTAGLAPMLASTVHVANQILWHSALTGGGQIDVIAHSQAGAIARAAIRLLAQPPDPTQPSRYPVHTLVTIGAAPYGISTHAPEFQADTGVPGLDLLWKWFVTDAALNACRNAVAGSSLPVCPDFVRKESTTTPDRPILPPDLPDPNNPDPNFYTTGFMPWVNSTAAPGRLPGAATGQTRYYHLYSQVFSAARGFEAQASERLKLFPSDPHMAQGRNWCVQEFVRQLRGITNYPLHHIREWNDPNTRLMMTLALAGATNPNVAC